MCSSVIVSSLATPHPNPVHEFILASLTRTGAGSSPWCRFCARTLTTCCRRPRYCVGGLLVNLGWVHDSRSREVEVGMGACFSMRSGFFWIFRNLFDYTLLPAPYSEHSSYIHSRPYSSCFDMCRWAGFFLAAESASWSTTTVGTALTTVACSAPVEGCAPGHLFTSSAACVYKSFFLMEVRRMFSAYWFFLVEGCFVHRLPTVVSAFGVALSLERVCLRLFCCAFFFSGDSLQN